MKVSEIITLKNPSVKVIKFERFTDHRGYFTEPFRRSDLDTKCNFLANTPFVQSNESFSRKGVIRGMHFQWNPYMGKLVRTISGHMVDLFIDIRKGSPMFGKIMAYDMPASSEKTTDQWIWIPPGFAHGNYFVQESVIEYFCTGEYSQGCEAGISPLAADLDWSGCDGELKEQFEKIAKSNPLITDKDRNGLSLTGWGNDPRSNNFIYGSC